MNILFELLERKVNKIRVDYDILFYIFSFFLGFVSFTNFNYNIVKYLLLLILGIYLLLNIKYILKDKKYILFNFLLFFLVVWIVATANVNGHLTNRNNFLASIVYCGTLLEVIFVIQIANKKNKLNKLIKVFLASYVAILLVCDIHVVFEFLSNNIFDGKIYLIGNKFVLTYFHIQFIIIYWLFLSINSKKNIRVKIVLLTFLHILLSILVSCSTSVIAGFVLLVGVCFEKIIKRFLSTPLFLITSFILSLSFIFWYEKLISLDIVIKIFSFLGENIHNFSGRVNVFEKIYMICKEHLFFGYGYGSSYEILFPLTGTADAQNGFWELVINIGIVGAVLYFLVLMQVFSTKSKSKKSYPIYLYICIMLIISFIEIPYDNILLFFATIGYLINTNIGERNNENK